MSLSRRRLLLNGSALVAAASLSACGTILYPERKGQISGRLDPSIGRPASSAGRATAR